MQQNIVLGSQSPRRRELLTMMGLRFTIVTADVDETILPGEDPVSAVERLCAAKAAAVAARVPADAVIITADTVVVVDGRILGKPRDQAEAIEMLTLLSGREHAVYTAFTVRQGGRRVTDHVRTAVRFRPLSPAEITAYVATGEPMDKAGAYGIQGVGALLVEAIDGDYFTVMGLPVCRLGQTLKTFGIDCLG